MGVYFVYRSPYQGPTELYRKRFDDATVLEWFQNRWTRWIGLSEEDLWDAVDMEIGTSIYGFCSIFQRISELGLPVPQTHDDLDETLQAHLYVEGEVMCEPHLIQVLTDDDELELAYYIFDDEYIQTHRDHVTFLLHEGWELPTDILPEGGFTPLLDCERLHWDEADNFGTVWMAMLSWYDSGSLDLDPPRQIEGLRLPDLARWIASHNPVVDRDWPLELRILKSQLLHVPEGADNTQAGFLEKLFADPDNVAVWEIYSDWLEEQGQPRAGIAELAKALERCEFVPIFYIGGHTYWSDGFGQGSLREMREQLDELTTTDDGERITPNGTDPALLQISEHMIQFGPHVGGNEYHRWIFIDDLWAAANPALANCILRYGTRWDVLTPDEE